MKPGESQRPAFDASAVLALMQGEPGAERLIDYLANAVVNSVNVAEVLAVLVRRGMRAAEARAAYDALHLETVPFEAEMTAVSARYVAKDVSLGDRCFLAEAERRGSGWTADRDLGSTFGKRVSFVRCIR